MKYIIESNDVIGYTPKYAMLFGDGYMIQPLEDLEELNSDYINEHYGQLQDEAYQRGYKDCETKYCSFDACPNRQAEYQRGLDDAWEAARNISILESDGGYSWKEMKSIFGTDSASEIYMRHTAVEAINKIKAYEQQKDDDEIKVGDVVKSNRGWMAVVTQIDDDGLSLMDSSGAVASYSDISKFTKTGRHFNIDKILEEMKE